MENKELKEERDFKYGDYTFTKCYNCGKNPCITPEICDKIAEDIYNAEMESMKKFKQDEIKQAIKVLQKHLKEDEELFRAYTDNIAMSFKDEVSRKMKKKYESNKAPYFSRQDSHECANKAAKAFLDSLINQ